MKFLPALTVFGRAGGDPPPWPPREFALFLAGRNPLSLSLVLARKAVSLAFRDARYAGKAVGSLMHAAGLPCQRKGQRKASGVSRPPGAPPDVGTGAFCSALILAGWHSPM